MNTPIHTTDTTDQPEDSAANQNAVPLDALISNALELHRSRLHQKLSSMLAYADQSLIPLIEASQADNAADLDAEAEPNQKNDTYEKLVRTLQTERDNIESYFFAAINEKGSKDTSRNDEQASKSGLSLIDQDEMDEMVAVAAMYTNAMNKFGEEVNNLATRFEYIEMSSSKTLPKHIFDLRHICEAYQTALAQAGMSTQDKILLFKLFDQEVSSDLGDMYKALNQLFIDAGILTEVVYTVKSQKSTSHPTEETDAVTEGDTSDPSFHADATDQGSGDTDNGKPSAGKGTSGPINAIGRFISQFMSGFGTAKGEGIPKSFSMDPSEMDSSQCYSTDDVIGSLSRIQSDLASRGIGDAAGFSAEQIQRQLIANMGRGQGGAITKTVHTLDQRRIDLVAMIFNAIAEDDSVSIVISNLVMHLQIPVIKTAMVDEALFTDQNHPARVSLDLITRAGKGVTEITDRAYVELKQIVNGILKDYEIDTASFETAVVQLQKLIEKEEELARENEKNEQQEVVKKHARAVVLDEMRLITRHRVIPETVRPLMLKHWPSLMFSHYMNHGIESSEWFLSVKLFGLLMEFLQPVDTRTQWQKLNDNHESLIETASEELRKTHKNSEEIKAQIGELRQIFTARLEAGRDQFEHEVHAAEPDPTPVVLSADDTDSQIAEIEATENPVHEDKPAGVEEQVRVARERISRLPSGLHPGVWCEVFDGEDRPVRRLKLSVILADVAKLIFVDRQGIKVLEKDAEDFVIELESGRSKIIADHSTFETALGSVIHTLSPDLSGNHQSDVPD